MSRTSSRPTKSLQIGAALLILLLAGCLGRTPQRPSQPPDGIAQAEAAARIFFEALHEGNYQLAADLYGGSYEILAGMNPDLDPEGGAELLAQGCQFNGFTCLRMGEVLSTEPSREGEYTLMVQFLRNDGEVFVLGPCCGEDETSMPPTSEFTVRVAEDETGEFTVLDLPPYVP